MTSRLPRRRGSARPTLALLCAPLALFSPALAQTTPAIKTPPAPSPAPALPTATVNPPPVTLAPPVAATPVNTAPATATATPPAIATAPATAAPTVPLPVAPVSAPPPAALVTPAPKSAVPALPAALVGGEHYLITRAAVTPMGNNNAIRLWVRGDNSSASLSVRLQQTANSDTLDALRAVWTAAPVPLNFIGWKEIVLPKSKFALRTPGTATATADTAYPPDVQAASVPSETPDWASIDTLGLEMHTARRSTILVDDIAWVTLDATGAGTGQTVVEDFEKGNIGAWTAGGTRDQQQAIVYGLGTQPGQAHGGRVGFKIDITPASYIRQTVLLPAVKKSLARSGLTYLVYSPPSLFDPILPTSLPAAPSNSTDLPVLACADQVQAATFCLYSQKALQNVTVTMPKDLQGIGHTLSRLNVAVHVVKVWKQGGAGPLQDPDTAGPVPELLVKDDRVTLSGSSPIVRLMGAPVTDVPADTTKQFWVTVSVPRGTVPGQYVGNLMVSGRGLPAFPVRLDLNVLPLRLQNPAKQYGVNLRSRLDPAPATLPTADGRALVTDFVAAPILDQQLADISAHGFRFVTLYDSPATLAAAAAEYKKFGFGEPFLYRGDADPAAVEAARTAANLQPFYYSLDPIALADAPARLAAFGKKGLTASAFIANQADMDALQSGVGLALDSYDSPYSQDLIRSKGKRKAGTRDWWYWPATNEDPHINRLDVGYHLWRANLYGAFVPEYQASFGADPYDETSAGAAPSLAAYRPQMLTYPAQDGVIDTLQWEATREGVNDVRYLTSMFLALGDCRHIYNIAKPLTDEAEAYVNTFLDKPLALLPDAEYDKARAKIADYAIKLNAAIDAYKKKNAVAP